MTPRNTLIYGQDEKVAAWVARQLPDARAGFGECRAIAIVAGDKPLAGVVYHRYNKDYGTIAMSIASVSPMWAKPETICDILAIPFYQYKVFKVWATTAADNARAIRFLSKTGWTREAVLRHQFGPRRHVHFFGMTAPEYDVLRGRLLLKMKDAA